MYDRGFVGESGSVMIKGECNVFAFGKWDCDMEFMKAEEIYLEAGACR